MEVRRGEARRWRAWGGNGGAARWTLLLAAGPGLRLPPPPTAPPPPQAPLCSPKPKPGGFRATQQLRRRPCRLKTSSTSRSGMPAEGRGEGDEGGSRRAGGDGIGNRGDGGSDGACLASSGRLGYASLQAAHPWAGCPPTAWPPWLPGCWRLLQAGAGKATERRAGSAPERRRAGGGAASPGAAHRQLGHCLQVPWGRVAAAREHQGSGSVAPSRHAHLRAPSRWPLNCYVPWQSVWPQKRNGKLCWAAHSLLRAALAAPRSFRLVAGCSRHLHRPLHRPAAAPACPLARPPPTNFERLAQAAGSHQRPLNMRN